MKNLIRLLVVAGLILASWWFQNLIDTKPELVTLDEVRFANYFLRDFEIKSHDSQGQLRYILAAAELDNYEKESMAELKQVKIESFSQDANWTLQAERGEFYQQDKRIELFDNVRLERPATQQSKALSLKTGHIVFYPEKEELKSDDDVFISSEQSQIQSKGMHFNNKLGILTLESEVKATYVQ